MSRLQNALSTFSPIVSTEKIGFLVRLSHRLTIAARGVYLPGSEDIGKARAYNEIQHKILGVLTHMLAGSTERYSDADLLELVFSMAEEAGIEEAFQSSWDFVQAR